MLRLMHRTVRDFLSNSVVRPLATVRNQMTGRPAGRQPSEVDVTAQPAVRATAVAAVLTLVAAGLGVTSANAGGSQVATSYVVGSGAEGSIDPVVATKTMKRAGASLEDAEKVYHADQVSARDRKKIARASAELGRLVTATAPVVTQAAEAARARDPQAADKATATAADALAKIPVRAGGGASRSTERSTARTADRPAAGIARSAPAAGAVEAAAKPEIAVEAATPKVIRTAAKKLQRVTTEAKQAADAKILRTQIERKTSAAREYGNGQIPETLLCDVSWSPGQKLRCDADQAFEKLNLAYRKHFGSDVAVTDSNRSYEQQVAVAAAKPTLAAPPGTSNHGWGLALDLGGGIQNFGTPQHVWMQENAGRFGFTNPAWARIDGSKPEGWHWEYVG